MEPFFLCKEGAINIKKGKKERKKIEFFFQNLETASNLDRCFILVLLSGSSQAVYTIILNFNHW